MADLNTTDVMGRLANRGGARPNAAKGGYARSKAILTHAANDVASIMGGGDAVGDQVEVGLGQALARDRMSAMEGEGLSHGALVQAASAQDQMANAKTITEAQITSQEDDWIDVAARIGTAAVGTMGYLRKLQLKFGNKDWQNATSEMMEGKDGDPSVHQQDQDLLDLNTESRGFITEQNEMLGQQRDEIQQRLDAAQPQFDEIGTQLEADGLSEEDRQNLLDQQNQLQIGIDSDRGALGMVEGQMKANEMSGQAIDDFNKKLKERMDLRLENSSGRGNIFDQLGGLFGILKHDKVTSFGSAYQAMWHSLKASREAAAQNWVGMEMGRDLSPQRAQAELQAQQIQALNGAMIQLARERPEMEGRLQKAFEDLEAYAIGMGWFGEMPDYSSDIAAARLRLSRTVINEFTQ